MDEETLRNAIVNPYENNIPFPFATIPSANPKNIRRIEISETIYDSKYYKSHVPFYLRRNFDKYLFDQGKIVTKKFIRTVPSQSITNKRVIKSTRPF